MFGISQITCPYCYNKYSKSKVQWRCNSSNCKKTENLEPDKEYSEYHEIAGRKTRNMPHIVLKPRPKNGFVECDVCKEATNTMICPVCHSILPKTEENIIISVIGAPGAGKSYYVGALLKQLRSNLSSFKCAIKFTTDEARDMYNTRFIKNFEANIPLEKTRPPQGDINIVGANLPILCDLTDKKDVKRTFTFFDAAGENFEDESIMRCVAPYISHSSAIILLLDPTQIPQVRNTLKSENPDITLADNANNASYEDILFNTIEVIHNHTRSNGKIDIPLAVGFSKWDLIENSKSLCPTDSCILDPSPHFQNGFTSIDCDNVSNEIEGLLSDWDCSNFVMHVKHNFKKVKFFGFSAIGANINKKGQIPNIVSKRVEDPFLWLLNEQKIIVK